MLSKRKTIIIGIVLFSCALAAFSVPQVAVLNTILAAGIDPTVSVPVTDKIIEEMVNSGKFIVIDRANVEQILREKEFQLSSGIVRAEEARQAGEYLGADFVVVANASRVGSTYVISAKMIDVVTGEIALQYSAEKQGKIDVLLEIARNVGKQICGQEIVLAEAQPKPEPKKAEPAPDYQSDNSMAIAQLQELIKKRTHMKKGGVLQMQSMVASLSNQDRMFLYTTNTKDNAAMALLLNLLITSAGSWVQGDVSGALNEITLALSGAAAMISNAGYYDYYGYWVEPSGLYYAGVALLVLDVVYMCVRPFKFEKQWNQKLAEVLRVPYVAILDPQDNSLRIETSHKGQDWRFGVSLVSIGY
jgi:TolB-like protein